MSDMFWRLVQKSDGCWIWKGSKSAKGYGLCTYNGHTMNAHRAAYMMVVGIIPAGLTIDHLCRNRGCVNPAHLEPVTSKENTLRGDGFTAKNARKTSCPRGHAFDLNNTYMRPNQGGRDCKICKRERTKIALRKRRQKFKQIAAQQPA